MFTYVDLVGVKTLQAITADYQKLDVQVVFANCKAEVRQSLLKSSTINKKNEIDLGRMYVSLHDAVLSCMDGGRLRRGTYLEVLENTAAMNATNNNPEKASMEMTMTSDIQLGEIDAGRNGGITNISYTPDPGAKNDPENTHL
ncbi:prestin-like [Amphiura filiformis]|uniref:prestin-like n=1 Tax=Amphiura filiformis TaxID=82378 RepID=UPI003B223856